MIATLLLIMSLPAADEPISLHPANPHYLLFRGKPTVLISSTEHYGAVLNADFDAIPYLDELRTSPQSHQDVFRHIPRSTRLVQDREKHPCPPAG